MGCAACDGTGWRTVDREGVRRVERCACWREAATARLVAEARIPPRYARCDLDNFILYPNEKLQNAVAFARRFAEAFPAAERGFCLIGPPGIGKTHIAVATLRLAIVDKRARGLYFGVSDLLKLIRSTYNPLVRTAEMDILRPVMEAELLVLDDLGAEKPSEWVEETMNLIVNTRYNERRLTIFTSNYRDVPDETDVDSLRVRIGFRMHSRLHEMCEMLSFDGPDFRMAGANVGAGDLAALWQGGKASRALPSRTRGPVRAQFTTALPAGAPPKGVLPSRDLKWPGGRAGKG